MAMVGDRRVGAVKRAVAVVQEDIDGAAVPSLATTRSSLPSPLKSPTATAKGSVPHADRGRAAQEACRWAPRRNRPPNCCRRAVALQRDAGRVGDRVVDGQAVDVLAPVRRRSAWSCCRCTIRPAAR